MLVHDFFLILLLVLVLARVFAEIASRLKIPAVLGELLAGVVLGPSLLGWVEPVEALRLMAEIGIILLLFEVGLGTDFVHLARTGRKSFIVALLGFALPFLIGFSIACLAFGLPVLVALFVGGTFTATSIGITVRVLEDIGILHEKVGEITLGAAVLDDIFGVILLALLYEFATQGGISLANAGKVFIFVLSFFLFAPIAAKLMSTLIRRINRTSTLPGLLPTAIVSLVLFFAWLSHIFGAPELLGGFAAGLALSRRFFLPFGSALQADPNFSHQIDKQTQPIVQLFSPIFFVVIGLSLALREIDWSSPFIWLFTFVLFASAVLGKMLGTLALKETWHSKIMIGLAMTPRGEVGLIFAELGRQSQVLNNEIYAGIVLAIVLTTLVPPFIMKWMHGRMQSGQESRQ